MAAVTGLKPLREPKTLPVRQDVDMSTSPAVMVCGLFVIAAVLAFFVIFR
jgi:SSS family solute:Na+ symporter